MFLTQTMESDFRPVRFLGFEFSVPLLNLKAKRGFGQGFPNWLKLSNMGQQGPNTLIINYCAYMSDRNKLVDNQN